MSGIEIRYVHGHFEAYVDGKWILSGDTREEVYNALLEMGYVK